MLFIGGPANKMHIEVPITKLKFIYCKSICDIITNDMISKYTDFLYIKEKIQGEKRAFYIMRYELISVDHMLEILLGEKENENEYGRWLCKDN